MASGAKAAPEVQMFAILFMLNGLGYLALVSALFLPALQPVRRITGFLLIGYTALTMLLWYLLGNRSTEGLMDYAVNIVEGVLLVLLLMKSWQERQGRRHAA
jgi:purine-cytosine permease-like protein